MTTSRKTPVPLLGRFRDAVEQLVATRVQHAHRSARTAFPAALPAWALVGIDVRLCDVRHLSSRQSTTATSVAESLVTCSEV
jgi:hypothetical protein